MIRCKKYNQSINLKDKKGHKEFCLVAFLTLCCMTILMFIYLSLLQHMLYHSPRSQHRKPNVPS